MATKIRVEATINSTIEQVWNAWTTPVHIQQWCSASPDWYVPAAENNLTVNGSFKTVMASRDGSMAFDFEGIYTAIEEYARIAYAMPDDRTVEITFTVGANGVTVTEIFDAENQNPVEMQQEGWQAILNNFKSHVEGLK